MGEIGAKKEARKNRLKNEKKAEEHCAKCGCEIVPDPNEDLEH